MVKQIQRFSADFTEAKLHSFSYDKVKSKYESGGAKNRLAIAKFRYDEKPLKFIVEGRLSTNGINVAEFGEGKNKRQVYSFGFIADDEDAFHDTLDSLSDELLSYVSEGDRDDYEILKLVKDDKIYVKLKPAEDRKSFITKCNLNLNPRKIQDAPLTTDQKVKLQVELGAYFNLADNKAGLMLTPSRVDFFDEDDEGIEPSISPDYTPCPKKAKIDKE